MSIGRILLFEFKDVFLRELHEMLLEREDNILVTYKEDCDILYSMEFGKYFDIIIANRIFAIRLNGISIELLTGDCNIAFQDYMLDGKHGPEWNELHSNKMMYFYTIVNIAYSIEQYI